MQELNEEEEQELIHIKRLLDPESPTQKVRVSLSHKRIPHSYPVWDSLITKLNPLSQNFVMRDPTRCGFRVRDGQQRRFRLIITSAVRPDAIVKEASIARLGGSPFTPTRTSGVFKFAARPPSVRPYGIR